MTITAEMLNERLLKLEAEVDSAIREHYKQVEASSRATRDYKVAYARAALQSGKKTVADREREADIETADLLEARLRAEGLERTALEAIRVRRQKISALQSIAAASREESSYERTRP